MQDKQSAWPLISSGEETDMKLFKARFDWVRNPRTGNPHKITMLTGKDSVNVLAVTTSGKALLIHQYRFGIGQYILELPGGMVDDGESHLFAAQRELQEETGYTAVQWFYLGSVASNPVFMDSYVHHYLALDAEQTTETQHEPAEDIEIVELELEELRSKLSDGELKHPHTVSGVYRGLLRMEGLTPSTRGQSFHHSIIPSFYPSILFILITTDIRFLSIPDGADQVVGNTGNGNCFLLRNRQGIQLVVVLVWVFK